MSTGDVGHFDGAGRLLIDGRDDEMIVSGGENLFPGEVEELLITHPAIEEAAVIGVDDAEFGKRLAAFVVLQRRRVADARTRSASSSRRTSRATRSRVTSRSSTSCRATRRARCSSASCASWRPDEHEAPRAPTVRCLQARRRTQAERRAATRSALLDAALACLVEEGYANLTTRNVAERAGVSQGTQMHYFPTRARFVAEAVRHVAFKLDGRAP